MIRRTGTLVIAGTLAIVLFAAANPDLQGVAAAESGSTTLPQEAASSAAMGDVLVPAGMAFVSSALGMSFDAEADNPGLFMQRLAALLQEPGMFPRARRMETYLEDVDELRGILEDLDERYGSTEPRLDREGSYSWDRAERLLDFMAVRIREDDGVVTLELRDGNTEERRQTVMRHLGVDVEDHLADWQAGGLVDIQIRDQEVPLMFGADAWREHVFRDDLDKQEIFDRFIEDARPRRLLLGFARLDEATRAHVYERVGLREIYRDEGFLEGFEALSLYLRAVDGEVVLPGGDRQAWEELLGRWDDDTELLKKLAKEDSGRGMRFLRALTLVDDDLATYLLTGNQGTIDARRDWAEDVYNRTPQPDYGDMMRWLWDFPELAVHLRMAPDGGIAWPGGRLAWAAAVRGDGVIESAEELDREIERAAEDDTDIARTDLEILRRLMDDSNPDDLLVPNMRPTFRTQRFLAVSAAVRYLPEETAARAVPLLYRSYPRYGPAFGFLVMPQPLAPATVEAFVFKLQRADKIGEKPGRAEALRELQSMLILLQRMVLNEAIAPAEVDRVLQSFFALPFMEEPGAFGSTDLGFGPGLFDWWNGMLATVVRAGGVGGVEGDTARAVLDAIVGSIPPAELTVGGIEYLYDPVALHRERIERHLVSLRAPPLATLFTLDELARSVAPGGLDGSDGDAAPNGDAAAVADALEAALAELLAAVPEEALERHEEEMLRAPVERRDLAERVERLARNLREADRDDDDARRVRNATSSWMGDALSGLVYAVHMGDPDSLFYRDRLLSWAHAHDGFFEDDPDTVFRALEPTVERTDPVHGKALSDSLSGVPTLLGTWNLEDAMLRRTQAPLGEFVERAWGAALGVVHVPSLTPQASEHVVTAHEAGSQWLVAAVAARDSETTMPARLDLSLAGGLRRLLQPEHWQLTIDAIAAGDETATLHQVSSGNRYLLGRMLDPTGDDDPYLRYTRDQTVALSPDRLTDYLGVRRPLDLPYGEASHGTSDPAMYARVIDVRVALVLALDELGLPPALQAPLLPIAMTEVLASIRPDTQVAWEEMLVAIPERVTTDAVAGWVEELAFDGVLTPR